MHRLRYVEKTDSDVPSIKAPTVFGEVKCRNVPMNRKQKDRIEKEILHLIKGHPEWATSPEIQYWVNFERSGKDLTVTCQVGVISGGSIWEDSEQSPEPLKAFRKCLELLSPTVMLAHA